MAINYAKIFNRRATPQSQPIPGSNQVRNSGGGYSWAVDDWTRLDSFLILGAEGGTYYIAERDLVKQNHDALIRCIKPDGVRVVNRIVEISDVGRAPKNDPLPLVPLLAQATRRLGIVPTISTSFYPPYLLARLIATLDLMSEGRVGCNFVTSTAQRAAQNFVLDEHIEHDLRYEMAAEFVEVVLQLWSSWTQTRS